MPRERRAATQANAAMYVGYADDDEDVDSIMAKFAALEDTKSKKTGGTSRGGAAPGNVELTEEELVQAVGLRVGCGVDYSMIEHPGANPRSRPKGEHVVTGTIEIVPSHVAPEEIDPAGAADAAARLAAGAGYIPAAQLAEDAAAGRSTASPPPLVPIALDADARMVELKGITADCRERIVAALPENLTDDDKDSFVDLLLRTMRAAAVEGSEVSLDAALRVLSRSTDANAKRCAAAATKAKTKDPRRVVARSKGLGLVCVRPGGIPAGAYLGAYCGELYPGWRWFEKEVAAQAVRRDVRRDDEVPVFYNAVVEREPTDPRGYDALFIDGMVKGSILTRASHSCDPNAAMRVRVRDGKYAVEMWTVRAVAESEEICWDYQCRTDSEEEMRRALCCCGAKECRVSYLHYQNDPAYDAHVKRRGSPAHFLADLLRACRGDDDDEVDDDAEKILANAGFKRGTRDAPGILAGLPRWLVRFAATCASYAAEEKIALATRLFDDAEAAAKRRAEEAADDEAKDAGSGSGADAIVDLPCLRAEATAEAESVAAGRLQSLAVTLDKTRRVLAESASSGSRSGSESGSAIASVSVENAPPPLAVLTDAEATTHLDAVRVESLNAARDAGVVVDEDVVAAADAAADGTLAGARVALAAIASALWRAEERTPHPSNAASSTVPDGVAAASACADLCRVAAVTKTFFRATPGAAFASPYVQVGSVGGGAGVVRRAEYGAFAAVSFLATWTDEYAENAEDTFERATRGAGRLPDPAGPLRAAAEPASRGRKPPPARGAIRGPVWAQPSAFALAAMGAGGGGEPWRDVRGWSWRAIRDAAEKTTFGSPTFDAMLAGDDAPGADAAKRLAAARADPEAARKTVEADASGGFESVLKPAGRKAGREAEAEAGKEAKAEAEANANANANANADANANAPPPSAPADAPSAIDEAIAAAVAVGVESADAAPAAAPVAKLSRSAHPPVPPYGAAFDHGVRCSACGELGEDGTFLLCQGCPGGGHLDCLLMDDAPSGRYECDACQGGRLAGITPPGRAGFEAAAVRAVAAGRIGGGGGGGAGMSTVPGAVSAVPSVGPALRHQLLASVRLDFEPSAALEGKRARDDGDDDDDDGVSANPSTKRARTALTGLDATFPMPRDCPAAIAVECGGALGEFNVLEGLVHCFCRGCQQGVEIGLQATNVFGLQAFEFHGGKGSAGKWKASIKAFPEGFPPEMVVGEDDAPIVGGKTRRDTGEALGPWLERECPEHPVLARSRNKDT